jgi:hypothetical protein
MGAYQPGLDRTFFRGSHPAGFAGHVPLKIIVVLVRVLENVIQSLAVPRFVQQTRTKRRDGFRSSFVVSLYRFDYDR